jgi:predicted unusual protein kinase regulating ubiquinone biosynthesis (AarF/ABC1/UbiB family)
VHKALLPDGTPVAVKIQYPGIHTAMASDMSLLSSLARGIPKSKIILAALKEIHARLMEEVDYRIEADNTRWFRQNLTMEGVSVPRLYEQWSGKRIITSDFIEGKHLDAWLADNPTQIQRNQLAQRLYDLFIVSLRELNCMHADPNPGNYLFHEDGAITLIDFGCVKHLSPIFVDSHHRIIKAHYEDDHEALFAAYKNIGMNYGAQSVEFYEHVLKPFGQWVSVIIEEDSFDFGKHNDYTSKGKQVMKNLMERAGVDSVADDFIFFNRTIYGLCKMFERLQAKVRIRHHWLGMD